MHSLLLSCMLAKATVKIEHSHAVTMHLIIALSSFSFVHFLLFTCIEGLMFTVYIQLLTSLEALLLEALT